MHVVKEVPEEVLEEISDGKDSSGKPNPTTFTFDDEFLTMKKEVEEEIAEEIDQMNIFMIDPDE